jgi:hypothetical protein
VVLNLIATRWHDCARIKSAVRTCPALTVGLETRLRDVANIVKLIEGWKARLEHVYESPSHILVGPSLRRIYGFGAKDGQNRFWTGHLCPPRTSHGIGCILLFFPRSRQASSLMKLSPCDA